MTKSKSFDMAFGMTFNIELDESLYGFSIFHYCLHKNILRRIPATVESFFLGTLFPDIRRVARWNMQEKTRIYTLKKLDLDFEGIHLFKAGWKFHLWCDMRREEILNKNNFYNFARTTER